MGRHSDVTVLLEEASAGDSEAFDKLYELVYDELVRLARSVRRSGSPETLNTTSLVHEAYFKLVSTPGKVPLNDRSHFMALAARAMRQVLVNAARDRSAQKRGGGQIHITLGDPSITESMNPEDLLSVHAALERLERISVRQAKVVECRFFAGLTFDETASSLGISVRTVRRDWRFARAWLGTELGAI